MQEPSTWRELPEAILLGAESLAGYAVTTGQLIVNQNLREGGNLSPGYRGVWEESAAACPITFEGAIAGSLLVSSTQPNCFLPSRLRLVRLNESEWGITNSPAHEKLYGMFYRAMKLTGQSYSPDGRIYDITPMLGSFLRKVGCINIQQKAHVIDFSVGTEDYEGFRRDWMTFFKLIQPFMIKMGVTTQEEADQLYEQMEFEMLKDDYRGIMFILTAWGEKQ